MKDIDAIVERFMEAEDANFSLFNYVNEVHAEVEKLEEQIADIKVCVIYLAGKGEGGDGDPLVGGRELSLEEGKGWLWEFRWVGLALSPRVLGRGEGRGGCWGGASLGV